MGWVEQLQAKNAQRSIDRIRKVMHVFKGEHSQGAKGVASRKLWHALHAVDKYLRGQAAWLVNYAKRFRAGLRVGTSITEGTANFLVNRRMNKSQQMRWSRNGADLLLQVRCAVYNARSVPGLGIDLTGSPMQTWPLPKRLDHRGRDAHYWAPPAQIRTCGLPAYGSYLGCLTAKRTFGQGCRIRGLGSHSSASWAIRSHVVRSFWLRRRSVRPHKTLTWCRKAASARLLVGTAW